MKTPFPPSCASLLPLLVTAACATTRPGAQPHDMSVALHEAVAHAQASAAEGHAAAYKPEAAIAVNNCNPRGGCWTSLQNPTFEHLEQSRILRQAAAEHRAASQALRQAEASACAGLSEADRDMSPFAHREDIAKVERFTPEQRIGTGSFSGTTKNFVGAVITFRAVPGMTTQWLQRVIDCHLARSAAMGHEMPEMPYCPLVPKDVLAQVVATDTGFAVEVIANDPNDHATAADIWRRAQTLAAP